MNGKPAVEKSCMTCGKKFKVQYAQLRRGRGKHCSRKCYLKGPNIFLFKKNHKINDNRKQSEATKIKRKLYIKGENHQNWKGGRWKDAYGYIHIYMPEHPYAKAGYVKEHRYVMEQVLGRYLYPEERAHHINFVKDDNRPENLMYFESEKSHQRYHAILKRRGYYDKGYL